MTDDHLRQPLERLQTGTLAPDDLDVLRAALRTGRLTVATGERALALGGSAEGAVIITGDNNTILLNTTQCAALARLLAAPTHYVPALPQQGATHLGGASHLSLALAPSGRTLACGDSVGRVWIFEWVR